MDSTHRFLKSNKGECVIGAPLYKAWSFSKKTGGYNTRAAEVNLGSFDTKS